MPDADRGSSGWGPERMDLEMSRKLNKLAGHVDAPLVRNSLAGYSRSALPGSQARRWEAGYLRAAAMVDVASAAIAALGILSLYYPYTRLHLTVIAVATFAFPALWFCALALLQGYSTQSTDVGFAELRSIMHAGIGFTLLGMAAAYLISAHISPLYVIGIPVTTALFDLIGRYLNARRLRRLWARGHCLHRVIAVGDKLAVSDLIAELRRETDHGLAVVGACVPQPTDDSETIGVPVTGDLEEVFESVIRYDADIVAVLNYPGMDAIALRTLAWQLEKTGTDLYLVPPLLDVAGPRTAIRATAGLTILQVEHPALTGPRLLVKAAFDRFSAAFAIVLLSPILTGIAVAIRLSDGGPALFTQLRVGKDGHVFRLYKFRTMVVDAEKRLAELRASNDFDGVLFKMRRDPRVTRIGALLRRWTLDELPELFNVLLGDMSLVGPRPALPDETTRYAEHVRRRLVFKPGITGLWQVNGRWDLSWDETVRLDLRYVENWSLALDLQILWKTVSAVFRGTGAY